MLFLIFSCNQNSYSNAEKIWNEAIYNYDSGDYTACVLKLTNIVENHSTSQYCPKSYYLLSEIYLNEFKEYGISVDFLKIIIDQYSNSFEFKKSLFTLGYINANYLDAYTDAFYYYNEFISKYPDDELSPSVNYELENLQPLLDKVESLINK